MGAIAAIARLRRLQFYSKSSRTSLFRKFSFAACGHAGGIPRVRPRPDGALGQYPEGMPSRVESYRATLMVRRRVSAVSGRCFGIAPENHEARPMNQFSSWPGLSRPSTSFLVD